MQGACHVSVYIRTNQRRAFLHVRRALAPCGLHLKAYHSCHLGFIVHPKSVPFGLCRSYSSASAFAPHLYHFVFPIEEKRSRESIDPLLRNRYFHFNQSITPLWFRFTFLFSSFFIYWSSFQSNQNPKTTPRLDHGDETKWEVSCLLRIWWESYVLQRCLSRAACNSVALPTHPFLGGSEPDQEDADWPRIAPHRRTGESILQKIVLIPWYLCFLRILNVCLNFSIAPTGSCIGFVHETSLECFSAFTGDSSLGFLFDLSYRYFKKNILKKMLCSHSKCSVLLLDVCFKPWDLYFLKILNICFSFGEWARVLMNIFGELLWYWFIS